MDATVIWTAVGAVGTLAAAGIAAVAAWLSRSSAQEANAAAKALTLIEQGRRHSELTPRFQVIARPANPGIEALTLRIMLMGPPGLDHVNGLTVRIRDDDFMRGEIMPLAGGPTREQVEEQIWGPYRFTPGTGPGEQARADSSGRETRCGLLPVGEELRFHLEPTRPGTWMNMSMEDWRHQRGNVIRLTLDAFHDVHGWWIQPCEIDMGSGGGKVTASVP